MQLEQRRPPDWFEEEPQLAPGEDFFLRAFFNLSTERQIGWASGPIPHSRVVEYGVRSGLEEATIEILVHVIRRMDQAYLEWLAEQRKKHDCRNKAEGTG